VAASEARSPAWRVSFEGVEAQQRRDLAALTPEQRLALLERMLDFVRDAGVFPEDWAEDFAQG